MCGRFALKIDNSFEKRFSIKKVQGKLLSNSSITPGQFTPVIIKTPENSVLFMRWGLIPAWAKDPKIGNKLFNARSETISQKPSFRDSFIKYRCLVPSTGFYEANHFFCLKDYSLFAFAGIYSSRTFSIITTFPNPLIKPVHDRMPVILKKEDEEKWLDLNYPTPQSLFTPYPGSLMTSQKPLKLSYKKIPTKDNLVS